MAEESSKDVAHAGAILFFVAIWSILSILVAESLTPGYDVSKEAVSGLGTPYFSGICSTLPSCVPPVQPASAVIVFSFFLGGALAVWSGYLLQRATSHRWFAHSFVALGVFQLLVGFSYIPLYLGVSSARGVAVAYGLRVLGAFPLFVLFAALPISSYRVTRGLFRYFGLALGLVTLVAFLFFVVHSRVRRLSAPRQVRLESVCALHPRSDLGDSVSEGGF